MEQLWTDRKRTQAEHIVGKLLEAKDPGGWTKNFQNDLYFRALAALSEGRFPKGRITGILTEMEKTGRTGCSGFEKTWKEAQTKSWHANQKWGLRFPWYVSQRPEFNLPRQFTVCGTRFRATKWAPYEPRIRKSEQWSRFGTMYKSNRSLFSGLCLSAESMGRTPNEAWDNIAPSLNSFRGVVEITFGLGRQTWSVPPRPKCAVPHPLWAAMFPDTGDPSYIFFIVDEEDVKEPVLDSNVLHGLRNNIRLFHKAPQKNTIGELLFVCLRLYAQARDERQFSRSLLAWWQLAEAITLSTRVNCDSKMVARRLAWFLRNWKLDSTGIDDCLLEIANHRNDIVHRGGDTSKVEEHDCNFVKIVCEDAIPLRLARNRAKIPDLKLETVLEVGA